MVVEGESKQASKQTKKQETNKTPGVFTNIQRQDQKQRSLS